MGDIGDMGSKTHASLIGTMTKERVVKSNAAKGVGRVECVICDQARESEVPAQKP